MLSSKERPIIVTRMASSGDIQKAFKSGDDDADNTLSVSEAGQALEKLSGKSVDASTIESAARSAGVDTSREMDLDEFTSVVRKLEESGTV